MWQRDFRDRRALQPDVTYYPDLQPPPSYVENAINSVTTRFVKTATNKMRCPIFCMAWTPEGRRLVTGASSGEFTLWNGLTFNFETILQVTELCWCLKNSASAVYDVHCEQCFMHIWIQKEILSTNWNLESMLYTGWCRSHWISSIYMLLVVSCGFFTTLYVSFMSPFLVLKVKTYKIVIPTCLLTLMPQSFRI